MRLNELLNGDNYLVHNGVIRIKGSSSVNSEDEIFFCVSEPLLMFLVQAMQIIYLYSVLFIASACVQSFEARIRRSIKVYIHMLDALALQYPIE
jgi:hypothetical protein